MRDTNSTVKTVFKHLTLVKFAASIYNLGDYVKNLSKFQLVISLSVVIGFPCAWYRWIANFLEISTCFDGRAQSNGKRAKNGF